MKGARARVTRDRLSRAAAQLRHSAGLRVLPPRVACFQWRARRLALRTGDSFSLISATRPRDLSILLELAAGRRAVVELGTAPGWTAIALALADPGREVLTYDPIDRVQRERYMALVTPEVARRITFVNEPGLSGPLDAREVEMLYIDSDHSRETTIAELRAWRRVLAPGALVVLDDYTHPEFPGVREAVRELSLQGHPRGTLFVHTP